MCEGVELDGYGVLLVLGHFLQHLDKGHDEPTLMLRVLLGDGLRYFSDPLYGREQVAFDEALVLLDNFLGLLHEHLEGQKHDLRGGLVVYGVVGHLEVVLGDECLGKSLCRVGVGNSDKPLELSFVVGGVCYSVD